MQTRKTPPPHTHTHTHRERERERERKGEGPTRFLCRMRATELKIVGEREGEREGGREREREREQESKRGEVAFYASKTDINHVSI